MKSITHKDWRVQAGDAFISDWQHVAERLISAMWNDPQAGRRVAIEMGLGPENFPTETLWMLVRIIITCAEKRIQITTFMRGKNGIQPSTRLICEAMKRLGEPIDELRLRAILNLESSVAGLKNYAAILVNNHQRVVLAEMFQQEHDTLLDRFNDPAEIAGEASNNIRQWMDGCAFIPRPPKLSRPPTIVVRPQHRTRRTHSAHKKKSYSKAKTRTRGAA